jgi:hypothetical protein
LVQSKSTERRLFQQYRRILVVADAPAKVGSPPPNRTVQKSYIEQCHAWQLLIPAGTSRSSLPSNSMLGGGGTTPQDYPQ